MSQSLKSFLQKNREALDDKSPSARVWTSIEAALPGSKTRKLWDNVWVWRAAALLFLSLSVYLLLTPGNSITTRVASRQIQGEFRDVESFYRGEIDKKVKLISTLEEPLEGDQFTQDYEKLDAMFQVLRDEMKSHPTEKVKDALILNMLVRIDLLNQQIKKLEDSKERKQNSATI